MVSIELGVGREQGSLFDRQSYLNQHCWVSLTWKPVLVWHNSANCWEKDSAIRSKFLHSDHNTKLKQAGFV